MQPELHVDAFIYNKAFPNYKRPTIIGYIGLENLKFARRIDDQRVQYDLNLHLDKSIHRPQELDVKLTDLLKFLAQYKNKLNFRTEKNLDNARFFCYRGLMACVACTPYEKKEPWKIVAVLFNGDIYLCARITEDKITWRRNMTEKEKRFSSWGYKFEQFILSDKPDSNPNPEEPVNENDEFSLVFTTNFTSHKVIFGAEVDGIRCDKTHISCPPESELGLDAIVQYLSTKEFIELKTNRHIEFSNQDRNFRCHKTRKWWCQSFLVGIETILCGFRNDDGIIEELKVFPVKDLVKMSERFWKPNVCFNFLDTFFTYVKRCLAREIKQKHGHKALNNLDTLPLISLLFEWSPGMPVHVSDTYNYDDDPILPDWFVDNYGKEFREVS